MRIAALGFFAVTLVITDRPSGAAERTVFEMVVYGGTSAAVVAAVQVKKMGKTVVVVSPDKHLGGLSSGGLGATDIASEFSRQRGTAENLDFA